jgi:hypothetical protein
MCIIIGRIIIKRLIDNKFPCPIDYCTKRFGHDDNLQSHFKVQDLEQNNSALNQHLNDNVQKAMSMGMLIQLPIKQTPELLCDVGLVCSKHHG